MYIACLLLGNFGFWLCENIAPSNVSYYNTMKPLGCIEFNNISLLRVCALIHWNRVRMHFPKILSFTEYKCILPLANIIFFLKCNTTMNECECVDFVQFLWFCSLFVFLSRRTWHTTDRMKVHRTLSLTRINEEKNHIQLKPK